MLNNILENLQIIVWIFGIFVLLYSTNTLLSLGQNIIKMKENFDKTKFLNGILKMIIIGISCSALSVAFTMITYYADIVLDMFVIEIPEGLLDICNVGVIIIIFFNAIKKYSMESLETLKNLLDEFKENVGK